MDPTLSERAARARTQSQRARAAGRNREARSWAATTLVLVAHKRTRQLCCPSDGGCCYRLARALRLTDEAPTEATV